MRKIFFYCLLFILFAGLFSHLGAQNITFKHLSTDNGLSQISVNDIYVDENNLIWIGTREGLNCYDGNDITIYRLEKDNPYSLFSNHVLRLTGDGEGHLYLLCMEGVDSFDMDTRRFATLLSGKVDAITYHEGLYIACMKDYTLHAAMRFFVTTKRVVILTAFFGFLLIMEVFHTYFLIRLNVFGLAQSTMAFIAWSKVRNLYIL